MDKKQLKAAQQSIQALEGDVILNSPRIAAASLKNDTKTAKRIVASIASLSLTISSMSLAATPEAKAELNILENHIAATSAAISDGDWQEALLSYDQILGHLKPMHDKAEEIAGAVGMSLITEDDIGGNERGGDDKPEKMMQMITKASHGIQIVLAQLN